MSMTTDVMGIVRAEVQFQSLSLSARNAWALEAIRDQNAHGIWLRTWYCSECGGGVHTNFDIEDLEVQIEAHESLHGIPGALRADTTIGMGLHRLEVRS